VKSLYRAGYLTTVARRLVRFRLDLVGVVKVRWEKRDIALAEVQKNKDGVACGTLEGEESSIQGFGRVPERKRPLGRPRRRAHDSVKIDIQ
jgi:hypothetical protein